MRELIWALLPGEELFAAAPAADPRDNVKSINHMQSRNYLIQLLKQ